MKQIKTLYQDYRECILDIDIFGRIVSTPQQSLDELTEALFEEFKLRTPMPTLESKRYELSRPVSDAYGIDYDGEVELQDGESLVDLQNGSSSMPSLNFEDLSSLIPQDVQECFRYEDEVTADYRKSIVEKYDLETGEEFKPGIRQTENIVGSTEEDTSTYLSDEQIENLGQAPQEEELAESSEEVSEMEDEVWGSSESDEESGTPEVDEDYVVYDTSDDDEESDGDYVDMSEDTEGESEEEDEDSDADYVDVSADSDDDYVDVSSEDSDEGSEDDGDYVDVYGDEQDEEQGDSDDGYVDVYGDESAEESGDFVDTGQTEDDGYDIDVPADEPEEQSSDEDDIYFGDADEEQDSDEEQSSEDDDVYFGDIGEEQEEQVSDDEQASEDDDVYFGDIDEEQGSDEDDSGVAFGIGADDEEPEFIQEPVAPKPMYREPVRVLTQTPIAPQQTQPVVDRSTEPTDIRAFLRKHPRCEYKFALNYFTKKQIDDAIRIGKIIKKGNILKI